MEVHAVEDMNDLTWTRLNNGLLTLFCGKVLPHLSSGVEKKAIWKVPGAKRIWSVDIAGL